ncbi:MAG: TRAP transporter small permease subunit [Lachnospiraceae bacterium]|nr:TRAP transporter small permease subunit [Lachnospiraceae bacterium]MCI8995519.1 TRAP transporter small permease subunit [Lachnospiraceae bacterium]MCI9132578.1 TRAP transporter small permease subunit [Lachnospiraceae bacterium]
MTRLKKGFRIVMDVIELYIPACWFILLFVAFILQIISRYLFNNPLVWPYELAQISYVWVITLGCCYAQRTDDNIVFSIVYEMVGEKTRRVFRMLQDILIVGLLAYMIPAVLNFYKFYFTRYSAVFKMPLGFVYLGFFIFQIITICRYGRDFVCCIQEWRQKPACDREEGGEGK